MGMPRLFWPFHNPHEARLAALENVLQETRVTMDLTLLAVAGCMSLVPNIAGNLRTAAVLLASSSFEEPDLAYRPRVLAGRDEAVSILNCMAKAVEANLEAAARPVAGGLQ